MIDRLVDDLQPVAPRRPWFEALLLGALALAELALMLMMRGTRSDLLGAMTSPMFWWKMLGCLAVALAGGAAVLAALDPAAPVRRRWRWVIATGAAVLLAGAAFAGIAAIPDSIMARLDMAEGMDCIGNSLLLALPMALAIVWLARRAAPTRPRAAATAAGVAASGWGAFVFAWSCPHADPLYVVVWYGGAVLIGTLLARLLLPRLLRW